MIVVIIFPGKPLSVKPEVIISGDGEALPSCVTTPVPGLAARRGTHVLLRPNGGRDWALLHGEQPKPRRMPPSLACKFTVSELAVLRIIGDEVRQHGHCARCVDELAARAGVCRSMVKNAVRLTKKPK